MRPAPALSLLLVSLSACPPATAQAPRELETSTYVTAQPVDKPSPIYPRTALDAGKEGWVMLSFVISPAGEVTEPMIEDSSGVEEFERAALRAVENWKYAPATVDGKPVEQAMVKTRIQFQFDEKSQGASAAFVREYRRIATLIGEGDFAAAEPLITKLEFGERKNLYEDAWFWWTKYVYLSTSGSKDTAEMRRSLQRAIGYEEEYLAPPQFVAAADRLVILHAQALDISAAISTFERLRDAKTARRADGYEAAVANLQPSYERMLEIVGGDQPLVTNAKVGEFNYWVHDLLRRSFGVADVVGRLDVLDIRCSRGTRRYSSVAIGTVWSIPESWGDCGVYVRGEPGATFVFREYPHGYAAAGDPPATDGTAPPP